MIEFEPGLRTRLEANLARHDRREAAPEGLRRAAVAIVVLDSDSVRDDVEPVPHGAVDMSAVPGALTEDMGELDGRMVGVSGGAAFLLCRRAVGLRRHAGQWALPGGRLDGGEAPVDAALRELEEELGLRLEARDVIGALDDYVTRSGFVITPLVLWCAGDPVLVPDPGEVFASYRIGLHALRDCEPRLVPIPESSRPVLQLPLGNDLIHAPTGAMLLQFRQVALLGRAGERVDGYEEPVFAWR